MELFYIQLPRVSRPVFESGSPTEVGPLPATGMGWVAPASVNAGPPIGPLGSSVPVVLRTTPASPDTRSIVRHPVRALGRAVCAVL